MNDTWAVKGDCPYKEEWLNEEDLKKFKLHSYRFKYDIDWDKMIEYRKQGKTYEQIAELSGTNVSGSWVGTKLSQLMKK